MGDPLEHLRAGKCDYCGDALDLSMCKSDFGDYASDHYKVCSCPSCGRSTWREVDFVGSGHDTALEGESGLESTIREVRGGID